MLSGPQIEQINPSACQVTFSVAKFGELGPFQKWMILFQIGLILNIKFTPRNPSKFGFTTNALITNR